jgi:nitroreductase
MKKITLLGLLGMLAATVFAMDSRMQNETLKTIFSQKSVREYEESRVPRETPDLLIRAGMSAPTAVDKRPWEFIVVDDKNKLHALADVPPYAKMADHAGAAILVVGDTEQQYGG